MKTYTIPEPASIKDKKHRREQLNITDVEPRKFWERVHANLKFHLVKKNLAFHNAMNFEERLIVSADIY